MDALAVYLLLAGFALVSGFNDGGNLLAVLVSSRILPVVIVIAEIGVCVFAAPFLVGTQVARTIGGGILPAPDLTLPVVAAALAATLATLIGCYATKVPTSITFALVGSMCGAGTVMLGAHHVEWRSLWRVAGLLVVSVVLAGLAGYAAHTAAKLAFRGASARAGRAALWSEAVTSALVCIGYGANDAEKTIGLLSLVYGIAHHAARFVVTGWMIAFSTIAFLLGLCAGGWRVARTVRGHVFRIRPLHAVLNEFATAAVVIAASCLGGPVSTTQALDSSLVGVGVGVSAHYRRIRWRVVRRMAWVWTMTMPVSFAVGCGAGELFVLGGYR